MVKSPPEFEISPVEATFTPPAVFVNFVFPLLFSTNPET
jgi:hypothetical protein